MQRKSPRHLFFAFAACAIATAVTPTLMPWCRVKFFAPFLVSVYYHRNLATALWLSLAAGTVSDLLPSNLPMGLTALAYTVTTAVLYRHKRHFFEDSLSTIPIMTWFFSLTATVAEAIVVRPFAAGTLSIGWFVTDLLIMPLWDALYAFILFAAPTLLRSRARPSDELPSRPR